MLLKVTNNGLQEEETTTIAVQGVVLFQNDPYTAPAFDVGLPMTTPSLTRLRRLVEEGVVTSLVERKDCWRPKR